MATSTSRIRYVVRQTAGGTAERVLQQWWTFEQYDARPADQVGEWRDVPVEVEERKGGK